MRPRNAEVRGPIKRTFVIRVSRLKEVGDGTDEELTLLKADRTVDESAIK
jgi:hypothetical protein